VKKIKMFLASSIDDLSDDRNQIREFFEKINKTYSEQGLFFDLKLCEDYDAAVFIGGKQLQFDRDIEDSELVFFLFFRKVGEMTKHEFDVAYKALEAHGKPRIIIYVKYVESKEDINEDVRAFMDILYSEVGHYYSTYNHIDTLKLSMMMQIKLLKLDVYDITIHDGEVFINNRSFAKVENIPILSGNESLRHLSERKRQLQKDLETTRNAYLADQSQENEDNFFAVRAELKQVSEKLEEIEKNTVDFITSIAEKTSEGKILTHRYKKALDFYNIGDYASAKKVLDDERREDELKRAEKRIDIGKSEIYGYIEEDKLWIDAEKTHSVSAENATKIIRKYEKCVALIEKYGLKRNLCYDYAYFLFEQNNHKKAIEIAEKLKEYYNTKDCETDDVEEAKLYNLLGWLYSDIRRYSEAEEAHLRAIEIRKRLANADALEPELAASYNGLGNVYCNIKKRTEAEEAYFSALEIRKRLAERNPDTFEEALASTYNNLGVLYKDMKKYVEAEESHLRALEIRKRLAERNPDAFEPDLAVSYCNLGVFYNDMQKYAEAEESHLRALEIRKRLAEHNPDAFEPNLSVSYNNLGILYNNMQKYVEAEESHLRALEIRKRLAEHNPDAFEPKLSTSYNNLGALYEDMEKYVEAEEAYLYALEIRKKLAERNPDVFEPDLVQSYNNLMVLYYYMHRYDEAENAYNNAIEIQNRLAKRNSDDF